jgi:hypothetical protein
MVSKPGVETKNAYIESARIVEDHGILTSFVHLDYGGGGQGFGGYDLRHSDALAKWVQGLFRVFQIDDWSRLKGLACRAEADWGKVYRIGHLTADRWFDPKEMYS